MTIKKINGVWSILRDKGVIKDGKAQKTDVSDAFYDALRLKLDRKYFDQVVDKFNQKKQTETIEVCDFMLFLTSVSRISNEAKLNCKTQAKASKELSLSISLCSFYFCTLNFFEWTFLCFKLTLLWFK